tara:strand:- start:227 stop:454 length:228 start_codon:yes stop_codon:yes gene_type:complete
MAFKMNGYSAFKKADPPRIQEQIKLYIKRNMKNFDDKNKQLKNDKKIQNKINSMSDGSIEYNWDPKTGRVSARQK